MQENCCGDPTREGKLAPGQKQAGNAKPATIPKSQRRKNHVMLSQSGDHAQIVVLKCVPKVLLLMPSNWSHSPK